MAQAVARGARDLSVEGGATVTSSQFPGQWGGALTDADYKRLAERWIPRELADHAGIRRVDDEQGRIMFTRKRDSEGIIIPNWDPENSDQPREYRLRLDTPERVQQKDGSFKDGHKYVQAPRSVNYAYIPRGAQIADDAVIILTEGEFKALALWRLANHEADAPRFLPIGFGGVWNWRDRSEKTNDARGRRTDVQQPILDLRKLSFTGRKVVLAFDADWESNGSVKAAMWALTAYLTERGAEVGHLTWDISQGKGIDDRLFKVGPEPVLKDIAAVEYGGWRTLVIRDQNGDPRACLENVRIMLTHHPDWQGVVGYDEFAGRIVVMKPPPALINFKVGDELQDHFDTEATQWFERHKVMARPQQVRETVDAVARLNPYHPVRDYLHALEWDGAPRIDKWLNNYMGVPITPYSTQVGAKFLISAVARVEEPGCKADHMVVLEGPQGLGKSTGCSILADPWFTDHLPELGSKDFSLGLQGIWIAEMAELDALSRVDQTRVKAVLSQQTERFRPPYGRRIITAPRQCVFIGTCNQAEWLRDSTGGRRYWPVECRPLVGGLVDLDALRRDRDQLWAEALVRYRAGELWWLTDEEVIVEAIQEQAGRFEAHPWREMISKWLPGHESVSTDEILRQCVEKPQDRWDRADQIAVGGCLRSLGWMPRGRGRPRRYFPPINPKPETK